MPTDRRSYADPCGVARALDAVGERWALLVVRELSLGPRRFGQLRAGLPDVSPNVLSQRLRELESSGVVRRYELDAPAAGAAYELTERGLALDPVLQALGRWGAEEPEVTGREMSPVSFVRMLRVLVDPQAPDATYGVVIDGEPFRFVISEGAASVIRGPATDVDATLEGDVATLRLALLFGGGIRQLAEQGSLTISGDRRAAQRFPRVFRVPRR